mmetsp:Transcript_8167/g.24860  ORF Transcript_8167/g.24860 Transcript_8167/m.24860 type:complete len:121 (-) Transcript_8167:929-1291(-)
MNSQKSKRNLLSENFLNSHASTLSDRNSNSRSPSLHNISPMNDRCEHTWVRWMYSTVSAILVQNSCFNNWASGLVFQYPAALSTMRLPSKTILGLICRPGLARVPWCAYVVCNETIDIET